MASSSDVCDLETQISGISKCLDGTVLTDQKDRPDGPSNSGSCIQRRTPPLPAPSSEMKSSGNNAFEERLLKCISTLRSERDKVSGISNCLDEIALTEQNKLQNDPNGPLSSGSDFQTQTVPLPAAKDAMNSSANKYITCALKERLRKCISTLRSERAKISGIPNSLDGIALTDNPSSSGADSRRQMRPLSAAKDAMKWSANNDLIDRMRGCILSFEAYVQGLKKTSDINQTLAELGFTPDSLTNKDLIKLFSNFNKLTYYIHADYWSEKVYEGQTVPNTMSVSVQTRHALCTSNRLLRQLDVTLRKYANVPPEYQVAFAGCTKLLEDLSIAISQLEAYQYSVPAYSKRKFDSAQTRQNLKSLAGALDRVIECVGKSQLNIRAVEWALNECPTLVPATTGSSNDEPSKPALDEQFLESSTEGHKLRVCRNIG